MKFPNQSFYEMPADPPPRNRQIYTAAKAPFVFAFKAMVMIAKPWAYAAPWAFLVAIILSILSYFHKGSTANFMEVAMDAIRVGLVLTGYLGAGVALVMVLLHLRR